MKTKLTIAALGCATVASLVGLSHCKLTSLKYTVTPIQYPKLIKPTVKLVNWTDEIIEGVKRFESFRSQPYRCPAGVLTVGYGYTGPGANLPVTHTQAEHLLRKELSEAAKIVDRNIHVKLTEYQRAALVSFTFNCGESNLRQLVNGKNRLNAGNYDSIVKLMPKYMYGNGKPLRGLSKRRGWELQVWQGIFTI